MLYSEYEIILLTELDGERYIDRTGVKYAKFSDDPHVTTFAQI